MRYSSWLKFFELYALFLSYFSKANFICHDSIPTFKECPALDINNHIEIIQAYTSYTNQQNTDIYIKLPFDPKYIHDLLTPYIIPEEIEKFHNNPDDIRIFYPSAIWLEEKKLFLAVVRASLWNFYSFLYTSYFDSDWNEIRDVSYIGKTKVPGIVEIEKMWKQFWSGPEDARIFRALNGEFFLVFNMLTKDLNRKIHMYSYSTAEVRKLEVEENLSRSQIIEKNWTPLIVDDLHIYFVYNHKNLQIIDCTEKNKACKKVRGGYDNKVNSIRGGSPYVRFADTNYFVSFMHTYVNADAPEIKCNPYRPALSIIEYIEGEKPDFKLIYTSEPFDFGNKVFLSPVSQYKSNKELLDCNFSRILLVHSIAKWNYSEDLVDLTLTIFDSIALSIRVKGITEIIQYIINMYEYGRLDPREDCAVWLAFNYHKQLWPRHLFNTNKFG